MGFTCRRIASSMSDYVEVSTVDQTMLQPYKAMRRSSASSARYLGIQIDGAPRLVARRCMITFYQQPECSFLSLREKQHHTPHFIAAKQTLFYRHTTEVVAVGAVGFQQIQYPWNAVHVRSYTFVCSCSGLGNNVPFPK